MKNHRSHFTVESDSGRILSCHYNLKKAQEKRKQIIQNRINKKRYNNLKIWIRSWYFDSEVDMWYAEDINGT